MRSRNASCFVIIFCFAIAQLFASSVKADEPAWQRWATRLSDPSPSYRVQAADELARLGSDASPAVDALLARLDDSNSTVRLRVVQSLAYILAEPERVIERVLPLLDDEDEHVRYAAEWAIARFAVLPVKFSDATKRLNEFRFAEETIISRTHNNRHRAVIREAIVELEKLLSKQPKVVITEDFEQELKPLDLRIGQLENLVADFELGGLMRKLQIINELTTFDSAGIEGDVENARSKILRHSIVRSDEKCLHFALARWGQSGENAVASIFVGLDKNQRLPEWSSRVLREFKPQDESGIQKLIEIATLTDNSLSVRVAAIETLGRSLDTAAFGHLSEIANTRDQDPFLRRESLRAVGNLAAGTQLSADAEKLGLSLLRDELEPWDVRMAAAHMLGIVSPLSPAPARILVRAVEDRNRHGDTLADYELASAADALALFGSQASAGKSIVKQAIESNSERTRLAGIEVVVMLRSAASDLTGPLLERFHDPAETEDVRRAAAKALAAIGPQAVASLGQELCQLDEYCRLNGLNALAELGRQSLPTLPACIDLLQDSNSSLSTLSAAANVVGNIGRSGRPAAKALRNLMSTADHPSARASAIVALSQVGELTQGDVQLASANASDIAPQVAVALANTIAGDLSGPRRLVSLLADDDQDYAKTALLDIGQDAVAPLSELVANQQASLLHRQAAAELLATIPQHQYATLVATLSDPNLSSNCQNCLEYVQPQDGGTELLQSLITAYNQTADLEYQRRIELAAENLSLNRATNRSVHPDRFARHLQRDFEWEVFIQPLAVNSEENDPISLPQMGAPSGSSDIDAFALEAEMDFTEEALLSEPPLPPLPPASLELEPKTKTSLVPAMPRIPVDDKLADSPFQSKVNVFYGTNRTPSVNTYPATLFGWQSEVIQKLLAVGAALAIITFWVVGYLRRQVVLYSIVGITGVVLVAGLMGVRYLKISVPADRVVQAYTSDVGSELRLGHCEVTIPAGHQTGELESQSIVRFEFAKDPEKHVFLQQTRELNSERFFAELNQEMEDRGDNLLVFIHGYNVSFEDAARRTAQMAHDLNFAGAPVFYSWPSQSNWYRYQQDRKNLELSTGPIKRFLLQLAEESGAKSINVVAHSLGSKGLVEALSEMEPSQSPRFNQVVLAAPDIDADIFKTRIAPRIHDKMRRCTVYTSKTDLALLASRYFNAGVRAGESISMEDLHGVEVVDASGIDTSLIGHSYYGEQSLLADLNELLLETPISSRQFVTAADNVPTLYRLGRTAIADDRSNLPSTIIR